jgi:hypothetical protein
MLDTRPPKPTVRVGQAVKFLVTLKSPDGLAENVRATLIIPNNLIFLGPPPKDCKYTRTKMTCLVPQIGKSVMKQLIRAANTKAVIAGDATVRATVIKPAGGDPRSTALTVSILGGCCGGSSVGVCRDTTKTNCITSGGRYYNQQSCKLDGIDCKTPTASLQG